MGGKGSWTSGYEKRRGKRKLLIALVPEQSVASVARSIITRAHEDEQVEKGETKKKGLKKRSFRRFFFRRKSNGFCELCEVFLTSRSLLTNEMPRLGMALRMATKDWIVLL